MSTQAGEAQSDTSPSLSSEQVRHQRFERAPLGRRGFDEHEVQEFIELVANELAAHERSLQHVAEEMAHVAEENRRLKHAMREWHRQQMGFDSVELMARTQQEIEDQIAQTEKFSREREEDATQRYDAIIAEARQQAQEEIFKARRSPPPAPTTTPDPGTETASEPTLDRQIAHAEGLLRALDGLSAHIVAAREALTSELQTLDDEPSEHDSTSAASAAHQTVEPASGLVEPASPESPAS